MKDLFEGSSKVPDILEFKGENSWLSNFDTVRVELNGNIFPSIEHAYVSAKSHDQRLLKLCLNPTKTSGQIKREGSNAKPYGEKGARYVLVPHWHTRKIDVMEHLLRQKFNKEPFKTKLLDTGNRYIQEGNRWNDTFWGFCLKTNKGSNHLGKLIMKIRKELQNN